MRLRGIFLAMLFPLSGWAQVFPREEPRPMFWGSRALVIYDPTTQAYLVSNLTGSSSRMQVGLGPEYQPVAYVDGVYWATNKLGSTNPKDHPIRNILSTHDGKAWTVEGWIRLTEDVDVDSIQPLSGDRFLLIAFTRIRQGDRYSKFAIAKRNDEKELVLDRLLDMGLEKPWGIPRDEGSLAGHFGVNPAYNELFIAGFSVLRSGSFLAVTALRAGFVWLMDVGKETPSFDLLKIHGGVKESMLGGEPHLDHCVLDAHPTRDGHFLFATRSERAVLFGAMNHPKPTDIASLKDPLQKTDRAVAQLLSLRDDPDLEWWELDPWEKSLRAFPSPPGVPERLTALEEVRAFRFWFTQKGFVACTLSRYVPGEPIIPPPPRKAAKGSR